MISYGKCNKLDMSNCLLLKFLSPILYLLNLIKHFLQLLFCKYIITFARTGDNIGRRSPPSEAQVNTLSIGILSKYELTEQEINLKVQPNKYFFEFFVKNCIYNKTLDFSDP